MVSTATRARLSPPAPVAYGARKRERSPLAPGRAPSWRASAVNAAARDDDGRWQSRPERVPSRVWQRFRAPQSALPSSRRWVSSDESSTSSSEDACTIMSYNILADYNARKHPDLYWDVPWDAMRWDSRRRLIIREIRHLEPDLLCLQVKTHFVILLTGGAILTLHFEFFCGFETRKWIDLETLLQI